MAATGGPAIRILTGLKSAGVDLVASLSEDETREQLDTLFDRSALGLRAVHLQRDVSAGEPPGKWSQVEERAAFTRKIAAP
ncbi:MAG: hypothetical protein WBF58_04835 [Xanthobacteraceae bacterium]